MSDQAWRLGDPDPEPLAPASPGPALVTMHFLLNALRRRWRMWVGIGCAGMLLGLIWATSSPPTSVGTVTLILAQDPGADPLQAQSTDVSLLRTRALASKVVARLRLHMSPDAFQQSVVSEPLSDKMMALQVSAPNDDAAIARAGALADAYLAFRATQLRSQYSALTHGYERRITSLREEAKVLAKQYDEARSNSPGDGQRATDLVNKQAQVTTQIESAQQSIEDAKLKTESVIEASKVVDPPAPKPAPSRVRTTGLAMVTGLIGGTAVGVGIVLLAALTSDRLRAREEIALALETPVRVSVQDPRPRRLRRPFRRGWSPAAALELLVDALEREVQSSPTAWQAEGAGNRRAHEAGRGAPSTRLALATVDTEEVGLLVMARLAARLTDKGRVVLLADLTESGRLDAALTSVLNRPEPPHSNHPPVVYRPERVPSLEPGPLDPATARGTFEGSSATPWRDAWNTADVCLTLGELDPALGAEHLTSWADEVVVLVAAGRSSAERLRTTGELIRSAGLRILFAMMVGADRTDESPGLPGDVFAGWGQRAGRSR